MRDQSLALAQECHIHLTLPLQKCLSSSEATNLSYSCHLLLKYARLKRSWCEQRPSKEPQAILYALVYHSEVLSCMFGSSPGVLTDVQQHMKFRWPKLSASPDFYFSQPMNAATHTKRISSFENFTSAVSCPGYKYKATLFSDQVLCFWGNICLKGGMDSQWSSIIWISTCFYK